MAQNHFDHAYACGVSKHVETNSQSLTADSENSNDSESSKQTDLDDLETFTLGDLEDLKTSQKKVVVESVSATDLGAVHEKLINTSPNKNWYINDKSVDKPNNGTLSSRSSSTETGESETEPMDVGKELEDDEVGAINGNKDSNAISCMDKDYTPMTPVPMDEDNDENEDGKQVGGNLLQEIGSGNDVDQSEVNDNTGDSQTETQVDDHVKDTENQDHGYAKDDDKSKENETDIAGKEPENDHDELGKSDTQNVSQPNELNGSQEAVDEADLNDSLAPDAENMDIIPRRGRPKKRRRSGWARFSPRKASTEKRSSGYLGTLLKDSDTSAVSASGETDTSVVGEGDTSATGDGLEGTEERQRPRRSRTPVRQNLDEFVVGEKAFDDIIETKTETEKAEIPRHPPLSPEKVEQYSLPMKHGWTREIVSRGVWTKGKYPPMDVYYHPPKGTGPKLRSMVAVTDWISRYDSPLNSDNFTFMRRPVGAESGEVVRHASLQRGRAQIQAAARKRDGLERTPQVQKTRKRKPEIVIERDTDDHESVVKSLLAVDSPILATQLLTPVTPVLVKSVTITDVNRKTSTPKQDGGPDAESMRKEDEGTDHEGEKVETMFPSSEAVIVSPPKKKFKSTARKSTTQKVFRKPKPKFAGIESLCTMTCPGLEGIAPLLRCNVCMCLFHPQCVNYGGDIESGFVCLRCVDLCKTVPQDTTTVVMEDGIMRVPDPTTFGSIASTPSSPVPIKMTQATTSSVLPNFSNLLSQTASPRTSVSVEQASVSTVDTASTVASPVTIRVSTPAALKGWPATQIKQEPIDGDEEIDRFGNIVKKGQHASSEALGTLKNMISSRLQSLVSSSGTPVLSAQLGNRTSPALTEIVYRGVPSPSQMHASNLLGRIGNIHQRPIAARPIVSPLYQRLPGQVLPNNIPNVMNPAIGLPSSVPSIIQLPVVNSMANNSILQTNSGIKLVPIGAPVKIPNGIPVPFSGVPLNPVSGGTPLTTSVTTTTKSTVTASSVVAQSSVVTTTSSSSSESVITSSQKETTPKHKTVHTIINTNAVCAPKNGQLLTLPPAVVKKITPNKPLQLKINNVQLNVPPSGFFMTNDGLKVFVPPNTFPTSDVDFCFSVTDDRTIHASSDSANKEKSDKNDQTDKTNDSQTSDKLEKSTDDAAKKTEEAKSPEKPDIRRSTRYGKCCHIHKLYGGYDCMQHIFKLLNVRDLISVGMVCRTWRMISRHPLLWKDVSFKDVKVSSWQTAMQFLATRKVRGINLLGLLHFDEPNRTWHQLISSLNDLTTLKRITFGVVPATVLHSVCERATKLEGLTADSISDFNNQTMWNRPTKLDIGKFACLISLKELRLKGIGGLSAPSFSFSGGLPELAMLKNLETLSIMSLRSVPETQFHFISQLTQLQDLSLGDCNTWTSETFFQLGQLVNLRSLCLEHGGEIPDVGLGDALVNLKLLERLELYTYTIADSLGSYLKQLPQLKTLILCPDNCFLPAEVNTNTLKAVSELTSLERLDWAIPSSCNTSIILDSNENTEAVSKNKDQQWIPFHTEKSDDESEEQEETVNTKKNAKRQTEYIRLHELQEKVKKCLPKTKTKVHCVAP